MTAKECIMDIYVKSEMQETITLVERWTFSLRLGDQDPNQSERYQLESNYHKRLCVMVRTLKTLTMLLPTFGILKIANSREAAISIEQQEIMDLGLIPEKSLSHSKAALKMQFQDPSKVKRRTL